MGTLCHLTGLSDRLCYEIITHLDDASATRLALGGSCARDAVEAHDKIVQQLKLAVCPEWHVAFIAIQGAIGVSKKDVLPIQCHCVFTDFLLPFLSS